MKPFYIYDRNIFKSGKHFYLSNVTATFGRVCKGQIEFCHPVRFNNWGFRDRLSYTARRDRRELRIAAMGDSFTANLDSEKAWPEQLDEILKQEWGDRVQVFNLGLTGAGPANWIGLEQVVRRIMPDVLLLTFYERILERPLIGFFTDPRRKRFYSRYGDPVLFSRPVGICDPRFPNLSKAEFERYSEELEKENQHVKMGTWLRVKAWVHARLYGSKPTVVSNQELVRKIIGWAPAVILALFPSQEGLHSERPVDDPQTQFLTALAGERELALMDFKGLLAGYEVERIYSDSSHHWNNLGNSIVAEIFAKHLLEILTKAPFPPLAGKVLEHR